MADGWVHLDVARVLKVTDAAMLVRLESGEQHWLPLSQVADAEDYETDDENCTVSITRWLAEQKELE